MRKKIITLALSVFALAMVSTTSTYAASALNYTLTVMIALDPISITGPAGDGGYVDFGSVLQGTSAIRQWEIRNVGAVNIDLSMSNTVSNLNGWTCITTGNPSVDNPAADQYRMSCQYTQWDRVPAPAEADFDAEDVLTAVSQLCTATRFAYNSEAATAKGYDIVPNTGRGMHIMLEVGTATAGTEGQVLPLLHIVASAS